MDNKIERIKNLVEELNKHSYNYYVLDNPTISDKEYDNRYDELQQLENETGLILSNSPTQKVQGEVLSSLVKVKHTETMLSADKSKDINDIIKFISSEECILSWKLDGLTIVLRYNNGKLQQAITRGGGEYGEDVTHSVKNFTNVPLTIDYKGYLEIRGEGLVPFSQFERINEELILKGELPYSSARNLASGSVRQLDANITKKRQLIFIAFGIVKCDKFIPFKDMQLGFLNELGFQVVYHKSVKKNTITSEVETFKNLLPSLPYLTDGLIIEYNDILFGKSLGFTSHHTNNMIALKHADDSYETTFRGVELNTTRTGMVSITALFDSVDVDGVTVSRASLHNYDIFKEFELGIGDKITVYRANSVIPQVEENLTRSNTYEIKMNCPSCGEKIMIVKAKDSNFLYCSNSNCNAKLVQRINHYCSKNAMNIIGLSEATIEKFIEKGFIKDIADLYNLEQYRSEIVKMEGFGLKSYNNLIKSINESKKCKLENFIFALGIPQVGLSTAKDLAEHFKTFDNLCICDKSQLLKIEGIGSIVAESIYQWLHESSNKDLIIDLVWFVEFIEEEKKEIIVENKENPLYNMHVYPTGSFALKKADLKVKLEELGAIVESGYKKSLDYLICADDISKSSKKDKAIKDGVSIITESELQQYLK